MLLYPQITILGIQSSEAKVECGGQSYSCRLMMIDEQLFDKQSTKIRLMMIEECRGEHSAGSFCKLGVN